MIHPSTIGRTLAAAVVSFACALACAWPSTTEADDFDGRAEDVGSSTTVAGSVRATSRLVQDPTVKGKWYIEIEAKNTSSEATATAQLNEQILRESMATMMARSGPIPTVAWKMSEKIEVLPNETAIVRHPLPAALSAQITASRAEPKLNKNGQPAIVARASFSTNLEARHAPEASPRAPAIPQQAQAISEPRPAQRPARVPSQSRARNYAMP